MNKIFVNELNKIYNQGNIVPFIGAGASMPFNVPDWSTLIRICAIDMGIEDISGDTFLPILNYALNSYDYWEAIRIIKKYLIRSEEDIQEFITKYINKNIPSNFDNIDNNYLDLAKYNFNIYLTTNYDHIMQRYLNTNFVPVNLKDINQNVQNIINDKNNKRIFHLHGNLSDSNSIVISEEKYKELYNDGKYNMLFSAITSTKTFLFIGFSFNDVFIQNIIKDNNEFFKSKHYIILNNPTNSIKTELKTKYNIETISYDASKSSHCEEIRKIIDEICTSSTDKLPSMSKKIEIDEDSLDIVPDKKTKNNLEKNVFCKKLRLENISNMKIDYSKDCFFIAERYFRWLEKIGLKDNELIADYLLDLAYLKYKDIYIQEFEENNDSNKLFKEINKELKKLDYPKLKSLFKSENMPNEFDKQGFIHILADNIYDEKEVWWGEKRFE